MLNRVNEKDLIFFFTYSLKDQIDPNAEKICEQLQYQGIKVCVTTKGDQKLANIISKKFLKVQENDDKILRFANQEDTMKSKSVNMPNNFEDQELSSIICRESDNKIKIN